MSPQQSTRTAARRHACACAGTRRSLVVLADSNTPTFPDLLVTAASFGWTLHREIDAFEIPLGPGQRLQGVADVRDVLKACLGDDCDDLRASWLEPGKRVGDSLKALLRAPSFATLAAGSTDSPVADIIDRGRIETWYQPIFTVADVALWGYECLLRARDGDELIAPARLLEWARQDNLLFSLDRLCRERHILNAARQDVPGHCRFLINFLPTVIYEPKVCLRSTRRAAASAGIAPERVIFEVVESEVVSDSGLLRRILDQYREWGFGVALDDVGAGHSGLHLLAELEPDLIKIDRGLIASAPHSAAHRRICEALVGFGHAQGRQVLAEGVETDEEWALVRGLGADLVQGFRFGKPAPVPALEALAAA